TLEELDQADLLVHVVDAADPDHEQQIAAVENILAGLGLAETPRLLVMNKMDLLPPEEQQALLAHDGGLPTVGISAQDAASTAPLLTAMELARWRDGHLVPAPAAEGPRA